MKLRTRKKGKGFVYLIDAIVNGKRIRKTLPDGLTKKEAEMAASKWWSEQCRRMALGDLAGPSEQERSLTLREILDRYIHRTGVAETTRVLTAGQVRALLRRLDPKTPALSLRGHHVEAYKKERLKDGVSAVTVNKETRCLKAALSRAVQEGLLPQVPCHVEKLPEETPTRRALTREEALRLIEASKAYAGLHDVVVVFLNTGLRLGELYRLRWEHVDLQSQTMTVETRKRGSSKQYHRDWLPLNEAAMSVFRRLYGENKPSSALVFGKEPEERGRVRNGLPSQAVRNRDKSQVTYGDWNIDRKLKAAARKAGIDKPGQVTPHCLRRTFATLLLQQGVDLRNAAQLMRHRNPEMTLSVYVQPNEQVMRQAVSNFSIGTNDK